MAYNLTEGTWFKEACAEQGYIVFDPKYIKEAEKYGIQFGTGDFIVYQYLRWCEDSGKYHMMVAGYEHIKGRFGFEKADDVRNVLNHLARLGAVNHIWCDTKIYRSKTQIWVSTECMKAGDISPTSVELSPDLVDSSTNPSLDGVDVSTQATPVLTPVGNNKRNNKKREKADSPNGSSALPPFSVDVSNQKSGFSEDSQSRKKEFAFCGELLVLMGLSDVKPGIKLRSAVRARLSEGYSELDLRAIARWASTQEDEFYKVPHSLFSEAGVAGATAKMKEKKKANTMRTIS